MWSWARSITLGAGGQAVFKHNVSFNFSILGQLTSQLEAAPLTPPTPLTPPSSVGANSPQHSASVGGLPSPLPTNDSEGAQAQPFSVKEEIEQFEEKYTDLVDHVLSSFKTGGVSLKRILKCLRQLPVSLKLQCGEFLQSQAARLSRVSSIDELFIILSPYWDFLNPSLLAHLANRFGDDQTIRSVDGYLEELREFRIRTKINNFIDKWAGTLPPYTQEIVFELGDIWRERNLEQLEEIRTKVSRKCWFRNYAIQFNGVNESSVDAVFSLPESVDIHSLELESLQEYFQEHQVLRILLNGVCILNLQLQQVRIPFSYVLCTLHLGIKTSSNYWEVSKIYWSIEPILVAERLSARQIIVQCSHVAFIYIHISVTLKFPSHFYCMGAVLWSCPQTTGQRGMRLEACSYCCTAIARA